MNINNGQPFSRFGASRSDFGKPGDRQLYVDKLHVYREWRFGEVGPYLTGLAHQALWLAGWNEARCFSGGLSACEPVPDEQCTCGFYGWYLADREWRGGSETLFGVAEVAGTAVLGSLGLRAARMRPVALALPQCPCGCGSRFSDVRGTELQRALRRYLPGVEIFPTRAKLVQHIPPSDWASIVGPIPPQEPASDTHFYSWGTTANYPLWAAPTYHIYAQRHAQTQSAGIEAVVDPADPPADPMQKAIEARRNRATGPSWLRDPINRRRRS